MFPIDPSFFFSKPQTYYGSFEEEIEEEEEFEPLTEEFDFSEPPQKPTGTYLHWFD